MKKFGLVFLVTIFCVCFSCNVFALTNIYETSKKEVINSGTNLTKYTRFTDKGWLSYNIVDVDLNDENTSFKILTPSNGINTLQNVKDMVLDNKRCVVAVNGDFFNGKTGNSNIIGMTVNNGKMVTSTYYENASKDVFASFLIDENNDTWFDYFTNKITVVNEGNGDVIEVNDINKLPINYDFLILYTSEWAEYSLGSRDDQFATEIVIEDGIVTDVRVGEEPVKIPENGYILTLFENVARNRQDILKVGDRVSVNIDMKADVSKIKVAASGGTLLVRNGMVAPFTHNLYGSNPRTAVGVSKDGNTLYLVTVDGRQASSIGLSQAEFADLLIEKGIFTALNLDGGGSTTMVTRRLGEEDVTLANSPSDGGLRNVGNAIGVFNTDKTSSLDSLIIEVQDENVFVGCEKDLVVKGYDKYYNPVEVDPDEIDWSYSGVDVSVDGNKLIGGDTAGSTTITASIGKAKASINIDVLSMPNELTISPKKVNVVQNESVQFKVSGQNKNGYFANLKNSEVEWKIEYGTSPDTLEEGVFKAQEIGDYIISVTAGNATSYALVRVSENNSKLINDFETKNFSFKAYPDEVEGKVSLDDEEVYGGDKSAKLTYDFTKTNKTRAAYLRFDESIDLSSDAEKISIMAYSTASTSDQIKAKITDSNGETNYLLLSKGLESNGWQELTLSLSNVLLPAKLVDIYVAQDDANALTSGSVYFDDLKIIYKRVATDLNVALPIDIKGEDVLNCYSELTSSNAFRIAVTPEFTNENILLDRFKNKTIEGVINQNSEMAIFPTVGSSELLNGVTKEKVIAGGYSVKNYKAATIITLDISSGGLRLSDSNQWISIQSDIKNGNKNVLFVMNGNLNDFKDEAEKNLFIDVLCELYKTTGKNIWVIQKGDNTDYSMKRGIKYLSIASRDYAEPDIKDIEDTNYILITVNDDKMTYEIKNLYSK